MKIIITIFMLSIIPFIVVILIALVQGCSVEEATQTFKKIIRDYLLALIKRKSEPTRYPTIVGCLDNRIIAQSVNEAFEKLRSNFSVCYFDVYSFFEENNCIAYRFRIRRKIDSLSDEDLQDLLQKQAEEVVAQNMQMYDCYLNPEPLTVVDLKKDFFIIACAVTSNGISKIDSIKANIRKRQFHNAMKPESNDSFTEEWHEE